MAAALIRRHAKGKRFSASALLALALAACGQVGELRPPPGEPLPVKPKMARTTPTPEELLTPPPYARPERVDEILRRSEPREPDRFDLPPADGGAAPALLSGEETETLIDDAGPVDPE